ncbi:alginate export family protein [Marinicella gelatinilytica]|uniref:alginate export family protein n=1 Tax=Marinicella gelatinilytica TaxID=2996017 RepID=UPI0022608269|nr:alginate export family protein [Marinicella gelatinilytica]MCX7545469.1 alginate export family protein [Marinicella gelatinilytica]
MISIKKSLLSSALLAGALTTAPLSIQAADETQSDNKGEASLSFRYRYELVDQANFAKDANASTLRTRLNYKTADYNGWRFFIEADNVTEIFGDHYNAGAGNTPNRTQYPVVADPTGTEINQAWVSYQFNDKATTKLGRQRILLDNQRFVGGVGWRQNEQTYDALSFDFKIADSQLFLAYIDHVNRIFGEDVPAGDHDNKTLLGNWSKTWAAKHHVKVYYYGIENSDDATFSTDTLGFGYNTHFDIGAQKLKVGIEYASQSDADNNPVNYDADYLRFDVALSFNNGEFFAGYEMLEGSDTQAGAAFRTPLATLHAFNGWADQFLSTPDVGIVDTFIGVKGSINGWGWQAKYHQFDSEAGSGQLGSEFDVSLSKKLGQKADLLLKAADYSADTHSQDTQKVWLMFSYRL